MASKLAADVAADDAAPIDPNLVAMERDRHAPMTFQLSGRAGLALRIRLRVRRIGAAACSAAGCRCSNPAMSTQTPLWLSSASRVPRLNEIDIGSPP